MIIQETKRDLAVAQEKYFAIVDTAPRAELDKAAAEVVRLKKRLAAQIVEGAKPCPGCGEIPHGMEQPKGKDGVEYEIGCISCGAFEHTDGTMRLHRVRGGLLPRHAVEAWNEGPDFWAKAKS
jgi:hypothetical protein